MKNKKTIIFDFDGTIADALDVGIKIYNEIAEEFGCKKVKLADVEKLRSKKVQELMKEFGVSKIRLPFLLLRMRKELLKRMNEIKPVGGIEDALRDIKGRGFNLGIMSSNSEENIGAFLKKNNLSDIFGFVYTGKNIFGKDKVLERLLKNKKISKEDAVYIGDEIRDVEAAAKAGIPIVAVSWGFNSREGLEGVHPAGIADRPKELLENIRKLKSL